VDIPSIARETIREIGYDNPEFGFDYKSCAVLTSIDEQSPDIAMGVDSSYETRSGECTDTDDTGAGDQGMMFGYACDETPELMPAPIAMGTALKALGRGQEKRRASLAQARRETQVSVQYDGSGYVRKVPAIVVSTQHAGEITVGEIREAIMETVIKPIITEDLIDDETKIS
jgi:S-adenosylmethionine synthetase